VSALVVVDAENVRRSTWPNLSREALVKRAREWAARESHELVIVFDGDPPADAPDLAGAPHADDLVAEIVCDAHDGPVWVVTSDRELRRRVGDRAERLVGGGTFVRLL
jgi:hypothetical protein